MHDLILSELSKRKRPIDVIVVGLGFMGFGFLSSVRYLKNIRIPLLISRRPSEALEFLTKKGIKAKVENNPSKIITARNKGFICISDDLNLIKQIPADLVLEMTGTVAYGTQASLEAINAKKHLLTMNPELQVTVGHKLKELADRLGVIVSDVIGDQPGSLSVMISHAKMMGFKILLAGNMKRYLDRQATREKMQPWADDKGLAVRQTVSFTDGTKQAIEMNLVANYFGMDILQFGMQGPQVEAVQEALERFDFTKFPHEGVVDYVIGKNLFPGIFLVVEHLDKHQKQYLRYLGLGEGPRYLLFEPYHLCHLEAAGSIAKAVLFNKEVINNGLNPKTKTVAIAKFDLKKGDILDGIGGNKVYGNIERVGKVEDYLPVGLTEGALLKRDIPQNTLIKITDVVLEDNAATRLLGLV